MMRRREFIRLIGGAAAAWPFAARGQPKLARIGFLRQAGPHEKQLDGGDSLSSIFREEYSGCRVR
jgi:hypothetical protein